MTWRPVCSQNERSAGAASWRTTPLPASTTGRLAPWMTSAARSRLTGSASIMASGPRGSGDPDRRRLHDVLGQLQVRRAGLLGGGDAERLAHRLGHHARVMQPRVPLGHGAQHLDGVDELVRGLLVHAGEARLAGERHQWCVVQGRVADAGGQVAGPWTEGGETHAGLAGEPPVRVGHEGGALLVPRGHEGDELRAVERLADVQRLLAGDAEDELHALVLETVDEEVGGGALGIACRRGWEDGVGTVSHAVFESSIPVRFPDSADRPSPELFGQTGCRGCDAAVARHRGGGGRARREAKRGGRSPSAVWPLWPRRRWRRRRGRGSPATAAPAGSRPRGRPCRRCRCTG